MIWVHTSWFTDYRPGWDGSRIPCKSELMILMRTPLREETHRGQGLQFCHFMLLMGGVILGYLSFLIWKESKWAGFSHWILGKQDEEPGGITSCGSGFREGLQTRYGLSCPHSLQRHRAVGSWPAPAPGVQPACLQCPRTAEGSEFALFPKEGVNSLHNLPVLIWNQTTSLPIEIQRKTHLF